MDDTERLYIRLDFWDDAVGAFEPAKVLRQLKRAFPEAEIDPTDHQRVRLLRELEFWAQGEKAAELRETLVRQSWGLYQTNGPTYRFVIPFPSGHRVSGGARRLSAPRLKRRAGDAGGGTAPGAVLGPHRSWGEAHTIHVRWGS